MLNTTWKDMTPEQRKQHFIARLLERYSISVSSEEYDNICTWVRAESPNRVRCKYLLKISRHLRAYSIEIKGINVLALYSKDLNMFTTALPFDNYYEPERMVPKIFRKKKLVKEAVEEYEKVLNTCCLEYQDFGDDRKNWEYYSNNCEYPRLMLEERKNGLTVRDIYRQVIINMKEALGINEHQVRFLV